MICANCGHQNEDNAKFCVKCGAVLEAVSPPPQSEAENASAAQNPSQQTPFPPVYQSQYQAPRYAAPYGSDIYKPMSPWEYFGWSILFSLPIVGFVLLLIFSLGGTDNVNRRNYARSYFCGLLVTAVVFIFLMIVLAAAGSSFSSLFEGLQKYNSMY